MKRFIEKIIQGMLTVSGFVTSIVILLIVLFLFTEGAGLFSKPKVEDGYEIVLNKKNDINTLSAEQIKDMFDDKITNWNEVGGKNQDIVLFRLNDITNYFAEEELGEQLEHVPAKISELISQHEEIIGFIPQEYIKNDFAGKRLDMGNIKFKDVFFGKEWIPTATPISFFGILPLITGTLWVSLVAILIALPFGVAAAIYLAEIANHKIRDILKPVIELLSGIPSVVYGFFGLIVIVPLVQNIFHLPVGETGLTGSIVLAIMALPTIITVSEDAMRNCPRSMREASLALGGSKWQTIFKIVIPYSASGITSAIVLGIGRAVGETMAVLMVTGNSAIIATGILQPLRTIPATIAAELGEAPDGGVHYQALFLLGIILFLITQIINSSVEYVSAKNKL
ncbi:MAG: phosphate ABC transporter permease subunit PstC [Bacteroidales bacterium]|nr:phosphate ABC transporter permease subunit PstC [Bacteroidales bacterium]MDD4208980.1 phosphate ABC transporter permease subunit PstC [Bacteroidales bacterium]